MYKRQLYDIAADPSECTDLADDHPEKVAELIDLWFSEAERHGALPMDDRTIELFASRLDDHSPHPTTRRYIYRPPMTRIASAASPSPGGRAFDLTARVTRTAGQDGVLWATGSASGGVSVFVQNDRLVVDYNAFDDHTILESDVPLPEGDSSLSVSFRRNSRTTGTVQLAIDGEPCGEAELGFMMRMISSLGASVGFDQGSPVSERYADSFPFGGTLHEVVIELGTRSGADTEASARTEMAKQ